ncbi:MAG TPA: hypothetical protein VHF26_00970, partial [Trebonia sp.]|nr:hypothetical protein [Trebonia sp.]
MTLQDPCPRLSYQHSRRAPLLALLHRLRTVPLRVRYGRGGGISGRDRRLLAALDRRLTAEAPALASKY